MSLSLNRRRRRRRRFLIGLGVVGVLVVIAYGFTRFQSTSVLRRGYLDRVLDVAIEEEETALRFSTTIAEIESSERPLMVESLEYVEERVALAAGDLAKAEAPASLATASVYLDVAVSSWREGVGLVKGSILALAEDENDADSISALERGFTALHVGDTSYRRFLELLAEDEVDLEGRVFPEVAFVPAEQAQLFSATDVVRRLLLSEVLGTFRDLAVSDVNLDPGPTGEEGGVPVIPWSEQLDATVTIANRGNVVVESATVRLEVFSTEGDFADFERTVDTLEPGQLTSLLFENLPVTPGLLYQVTVLLPDGDDDRTNDSIAIVFRRNENL